MIQHLVTQLIPCPLSSVLSCLISQPLVSSSAALAVTPQPHPHLPTSEPLAANMIPCKLHFTFHIGMGNMIMSLPNGDAQSRIKLTQVLYTPTLGFTLVSIGCIDDAGFYSTFGGGKCKIQTKECKTIGLVLKSGGVY